VPPGRPRVGNRQTGPTERIEKGGDVSIGQRLTHHGERTADVSGGHRRATQRAIRA
jgi:hypothetical protein